MGGEGFEPPALFPPKSLHRMELGVAVSTQDNTLADFFR
jgi:hypothetical protein